MKGYVKIVCICVGVAAFGAFAGWRAHVAAQAKQSWYGIVVDTTNSHSKGTDQACATAMGIVEKIIRESADKPGTRMEVFALGDSSHRGEPIPLTMEPFVPVRTKLSMGQRELEQLRNSYTASIYNNCVAAKAPEYSAIYLSAERVLEDAHAQNCGVRTGCTVYIDTDGLENVDRPLKARLTGKALKRDQTTRLDNGNVQVRFCGLAEQNAPPLTRGATTHQQTAFQNRRDPVQIEAIWRSVFADTRKVSFEPFCPRPADSTKYLQAQSMADPQSQIGYWQKVGTQ